ncbi:hypothetical protein Tco_0978679 [Tanacetum coccineum]|uniref:Uncharacterized protein n=1 Tax=Tanacetum coccineum TaxID=301880 RepID=A0ABQ5EP28_9ASTR
MGGGGKVAACDDEYGWCMMMMEVGVSYGGGENGAWPASGMVGSGCMIMFLVLGREKSPVSFPAAVVIGVACGRNPACGLRSNFGELLVKDKLKAQFGAKTKTYEEKMLFTTIRHIQQRRYGVYVPAHHKNTRKDQFPIRRINDYLYAVCTAGHQLKIGS